MPEAAGAPSEPVKVLPVLAGGPTLRWGWGERMLPHQAEPTGRGVRQRPVHQAPRAPQGHLAVHPQAPVVRPARSRAASRTGEASSEDARSWSPAPSGI
ncbi:MAG: hypothetical protein HY713_07555 [candidate division NC10 bacterium]|nr:hypothetical protein [candidate division NC10 bacterium]